MSIRFITTILTIACTITALSAAPVRADDGEALRKFLGTAAGLYITGRILNELADRDRAAIRVEKARPKYRDREHHARHKQERRYGHKPLLPRHCLIRVNRDFTTFAVGNRCMRRHYSAYHRLPDRCRMALGPRRYDGGPRRTGYAVRCLRQQGFEIARY